MSIRSLAGLLALASFSVLAAEAPEKIFMLSISNGAVPKEQRTMRVEKGDAVRVRVKTDVAGDLHLHGYRLSLRLTPQSTGELELRAYATGRYPFEWHGAGEAAASRSHRGPPLATLEVRPK